MDSQKIPACIPSIFSVSKKCHLYFLNDVVLKKGEKIDVGQIPVQSSAKSSLLLQNYINLTFHICIRDGLGGGGGGPMQQISFLGAK